MPDAWQSRFYAVCALGTATLATITFALGGSDWFAGFTVGFGVASTLGLFFLSVQYATLRERVEDV